MASVKSVFEDLPLKKQQTLARLFEMDEYKVLKEAMELLVVNQGKNALMAQGIEELKYLAGQAYGLKLLHQNLKELHKRLEKD